MTDISRLSAQGLPHNVRQRVALSITGFLEETGELPDAAALSRRAGIGVGLADSLLRAWRPAVARGTAASDERLTYE